MSFPRHAPAGRSFWAYPLWALPLPEALFALLLWLINGNHLRPPAGLATLLNLAPVGGFDMWGIWLQCAFLALLVSMIAAVFPTNSYLPETILLVYTVLAFLVGVYFLMWGTGVEIGLGLIAYSGRATLVAGVSLLLRRLLLQWRLGRKA